MIYLGMKGGVRKRFNTRRMCLEVCHNKICDDDDSWVTTPLDKESAVELVGVLVFSSPMITDDERKEMSLAIRKFLKQLNKRSRSKKCAD